MTKTEFINKLSQLEFFYGIVDNARLNKTNEAGDNIYTIPVRFLKDGIMRYHQIEFVVLNEGQEAIGDAGEHAYFLNGVPSRQYLDMNAPYKLTRL